LYPLTKPESVAIAVAVRDPTVSLTMHIAFEMGKPIFPGVLETAPGPARERRQPASTLVLKGSPLVPPTLRLYPLTKPESVAITIKRGHPTVPLTLAIVLKTGESFFPGVFDRLPGPARKHRQPMTTLFLKGSPLVPST
jgi:hypothetical protein